MKMASVLILSISFLFLSGCSATYTAVAKSELDVQTEMSDSIFLDPVSDNQRSVYVRVQNTSDKSGIVIEEPLVRAFIEDGYHVTDNADEAHYWLQINVLKVSKENRPHGRDDGSNGAATGAAFGSLIGNGDGETLAIIIGTIIGAMVDASFQDTYYTMITDVQISERTNLIVRETTDADIQQGMATSTLVQYEENGDRKKYRTQITSIANKVNLDYQEAEQELVSGLISSLTGVL